MILRQIEASIKEKCNQKKVVLLLGARQTGKTTLLKKLTSGQTAITWLNADEPTVQTIFENFSVAGFSAYIGKSKLVVIDEAQQIQDIGKKLKLLYDSDMEVQIVATGSSAFDLKNNTNEPLTGRKWEFNLYPLSFNEMAEHTNPATEIQELERRLVFGSYPEIITHPGEEKERLHLLADSYLYKDILMWQGLKKPEKIIQLLKVLALQVGNEVNYNELGKQLQLTNDTVEKYIALLEQTYVLFKLPSYSRNVKKELTKGKKIYFSDTGIRNALLGDYRPVAIRQDVGALWENYIICELWKQNVYNNQYGSFYFWRTADQQEIDLIIDKDGMLHTFEIKWNPKAKARLSATFSGNYPNHTFTIINKENYWQYIG